MAHRSRWNSRSAPARSRHRCHGRWIAGLNRWKARPVLVVEDEAALGAAVAESLQDAGFVVERANDGFEALERVRQQHFDLIICDLKMPRVGGMEFYRELESSKPEMTRRIMFVTGDVAGTDAERFLEETGTRWLAKPFRLKDLLRAARDMVA